jgi:hypothetical protein
MTHPTLFKRNMVLGLHGSARMATSCPADDRTETVFVVGLAADFSTYRTILGANSSAGRQIRLDQTTGKVTCNSQGTAAVFTTTTLAATAGSPFVLCVKLDTTTWECRMTGQTTETGSNSTTFTAGRTTNIGENTTANGERFYGMLGEIVVFNTTLSSGDIDLMMAYLQGKWGIS